MFFIYKTKIKKSELKQVTSSNESYLVLKDIWSNKIEYVEEFLILCLNKSNKVLGWYKISQGGISETTVDIRLICQTALISNSSAVIVSHNHPSGNLTPSNADIQITKKIKEALKLLDIQLLDHVIVTDEIYYSFADEGVL